MSPYPRREEQQEESRLLGILIFASSKAKPRAPLKCRVLAGCGVAQVLADSSSAWLLRALHRAGPGGCKFSMRLRFGGFRICLRQLCERCLSIPQLLFHLAGLFLQLWLLQGGGFAVLQAGQGDTVWAAALPGFSHSHSSSMACCCFSPSQSIPSWGEATPVDGLQSHTHGLPLPSPVPAKRMGCRWPPWCQNYCWPPLGFHPGGKASIWASLHLVVLKQILPMQFFPLLSYHCHSISHWDALYFFLFFQLRTIRKIIIFSIGKQLDLVSSTDTRSPSVLAVKQKERP